MRKNIYIILSIICSLIIGFKISDFFNLERTPSDYVRVTVNNQSGFEVKTLTLQHNKGEMSRKNLGKEESINFYFKNGGEGSFRLKALLINGATIYSKEEYVEAGYRSTEILLPTQFRIKSRSF